MIAMDQQVGAADLTARLPGDLGPGVSRGPLDVLLIDASALNRSCFSAGLDQDHTIRLVACASVDDIVPAGFARGAPDVIILRLMGDEVVEGELTGKLGLLTDLFPKTAIILIVPAAEPRHVLAAMQHEVWGLTTDQLSMTSTIDVIRLVHAGMVVYPPSLFDSFRQARPGDPDFSVSARRSAIGKLTARQHEVLRLLAGGMPNKDIGEVLGISGSTVKVHVRAIMERLGLVNRTQAAASFLKAQS